ncbi:MAG: DoxX family protein [Candidatus Paceibacteria bacterium]
MTTLFLIVQVVLGFIYLMAGAMKTFMQGKARSMMPALAGYPKPFITFIGLSEMAGALGLTLPVWLNTAPVLTPLAALGLAVIMLGAIFAHLKRREMPQLMMAAVFLAGLIYIISVTL